MDFKRKYETCDNIAFEDNPRVGSGAARNYGWHIAKQEGAKYHWIVDDNIRDFYFYNNNRRLYARFDTFACVERFVDNYENVTMAGMQYRMFVSEKQKNNPIIINTRIFSCNLIKTDAPFSWRGRYNEDVILSMDMLEKGFCTILFNTYLCDKVGTQIMKGGNTDEIYKKGTEEKSRLLKSVYPDKVELVMRYGRHHHYVNFKKYYSQNKLIRKQVT